MASTTGTHTELDLLSLISGFGESCTIVPCIISQPASYYVLKGAAQLTGFKGGFFDSTVLEASAMSNNIDQRIVDVVWSNFSPTV